MASIFSQTWTIQDLMNMEANRAQKSSACIVQLAEVYHEIKQETILEKFKKYFTRRKDLMNVYYVIFKYKVTSDTGHTHTVIIRTLADPECTEASSNKIQIFCTCPDFMYRSAYNLGKHDALFRNIKIDGALGPALTDAPSNKTASSILCKHAYAALNNFMQNYSRLMKTI